MNQRKHTKQLRRQLRWAGLSATVLAAPASFAQDCPKPTLQQCVDVDYRASSCGGVHDAYCQDLVEAEWKAGWEAAPKRLALLPEELGGGVDTVAYQAHVPKRTRFQGMDQSIMGQVLKGQILYRKNLENLSKDEEAYLSRIRSWEKDGTQVTSCQEFVEEKYLDFSRFEREAGRYGEDYRAFFKAAFDKGGIAHRTLYSRDQAKLAPIWGEQRTAKNAYFRFTPGPYPKGIEGYVFKSEAAKLADNVEARNWVTPSDEWHEKQSEQFSQVPDDVLNHAQVEQESFSALLNQRAAVYAEWQRASKILRARDHKTEELDKQTAERLYGLDKAIEASLVKAQKDGCLDARGPTVCDWSPRRYKTMLEAAMAPRREADLQACLFLTGNDFGPESFVRNADKLKVEGLDQKDYTLSSSLLAKYIAIYGQYIQGLDTPTNPPTAEVRHGGESSDSGYAGDATFGGGYDYTAGWEYLQPGSDLRNKAGGAWCDSDVRLYGEFNAYANVFSSTRHEVAHVSGEAGTEGNGIRLKLDARVLGISLYSHDQHHPLRVTFYEGKPVFESDAAKASTTFVIVFVPVTVQGGLSAEAGVKMNIGGAVSRRCEEDLLGVDLYGTITPFAAVKGFASVGIGVPGLQVGVRGELLITRVNVPLYGDIGLYLSSPSHPTNPNTLFLRASSKLDLELRFLDGSIKLFGELAFLKGEVTIVSWNGFGNTWNIYDESKSLPLVRVY
ncbi:hypothetical protein [Corallococcus macrosporus]|uniref:Lipoprotein n=1 Tax=Corallococcus macrosporus DSM 14697 TaxID=1189310 RepID=A0A250JNP6_9BACT|nr:hypothetical protein [Corallococcus macrosporus]ATB45021.1 hypothetical protein MYMAC_000604 [Corallococcus macrosporus DSM 14697]